MPKEWVEEMVKNLDDLANALESSDSLLPGSRVVRYEECPDCSGYGLQTCDRCSGEGCSVYGIAANGECTAGLNCPKCQGKGYTKKEHK